MSTAEQLQAQENRNDENHDVVFTPGTHVDTNQLELLMDKGFDSFQKEIEEIEEIFTELKDLASREEMSDAIYQIREQITTLEIKRAMLVKLLWRKNDYNLLTSINPDGNIQPIIARLDDLLKELPVFVTEQIASKDNRELRPASSILTDIDYLAKSAIDDNSIKNETNLRNLLKDLHSLLDGRHCYTRPGLDGAQDLLTDAVIIQQLLDAAIARDPSLDIASYIDTLPIDSNIKKGLIEKLKDESRTEETLDEIDEVITTEQREEYNSIIEKSQETNAVDLIRSIDSILDRAGRTTLDVINMDDYDSLPLELHIVLKENPELADSIRTLQENGVALRVERSIETPETVLNAINRIAVLTQENYLINWLPPLILDGKHPNLTITEHGRKRAKGIGLIKDDEAPDLTSDVEIIENSIVGYLQLTDINNSKDPSVNEAMDALNESLNTHTREYALNRMLFDNANERTHEAQEIVKKMMYVGPIAHALELLNLGTLAKLFAASADDLMGEYAEIKALMGSGFSKSELIARLKVLVPVFGLATLGATEVEVLLEEGNEMAAGALFGVSAVALSLTTAVQSIKMYKSAYETLIKEGKIDGTISPLINNEEFQKALKEMEKDKAILDDNKSEELITVVKTTLDEMGDLITEEEKSKILESLSGKTADKIASFITKPKNLKVWKEAIRQDFSNPARLGIMLGASLAPFAGIIAAESGGMRNGFIMAAIGSTESVVAGLTVIAAQRINEFKYELRLEKELEDIKNPKSASLQAKTTSAQA